MFCKIVNWTLNPNKHFQMVTLDHQVVLIGKYILCLSVHKRDFLAEFYTEPKEAEIHW